MGVRLSEDELWEKIRAAHTAIVVTLRRDGRAVPLPLWFVAENKQVYIGTPAASKKVARLRRDERASFLVESGEAWVDLAAVVLQVRAEFVDGDAETARIQSLMDAKYAGFALPRSSVPTATKKHYTGWQIIRLVPVEAPVSWDNSKIRLSSGVTREAKADA
jgi:nitroimidazol reductase NimA-like FMN-containing flavoprotein (pyridoxamine 5'-phosphate oxidase superfamily)